MADLLLQAADARQSGNINLAKQLLAQALVQDPRNEGAWMLMSEVVDDIKLKRNCLERVLAINPANAAASITLTKLDTSPLGPVMRGERSIPIIPPKPGKAPPFTPPFTWTGDESQFQALGDMTFPDLTGENANQPPESPTTFDWATESGEPDKTIDKIFEAVSNPEKAAQPLPDSNLSLLDTTPTDGQGGSTPVDQQDNEAKQLDELVGPKMEGRPDQQAVNLEDFKVSALPEWGTDAFAYTGETTTGSAEPEPLLWDNPTAKIDRLVILGNTSIIYANPIPMDIPHIIGLFNEKKMLRDLLGENARVIKLESIQSLQFDPKSANLSINYKANDKVITRQLTFKDQQVRDDVLAALKLRLGSGFSRKTHSYSMKDKILAPVLCLVLVALLGWGLIAGLPLLSGIPAFQSGILQLILYNVQYYVNLIGTSTVFVIALILVALCLVWLVSNLIKPSELVTEEKA